MRAGRTTRVAILILWVLLFALMLRRDYLVPELNNRETAALIRGEEESYNAIYLDQKKIGYLKTRERKSGPGLAVDQETLMRLNIQGRVMPVRMKLAARIDTDRTLRDFSLSLETGFYRMRARGRVKGSRIDFTLDTGSGKIHDTITMDRPPRLSLSNRAYLLDQGLEPGDKVRMPFFDPVSLKPSDSIIEYRGREKVLINGRVRQLHRFDERMAGMAVGFWLDDEGRTIKEKSPAGFVMVREPEFKAKKIADLPPELLGRVAVTPRGETRGIAGARQVRYRLTLPKEGDFDLDSGRQKFDQGILTITLEQKGDAAGDRPVAKWSLATPFIQSDNPEIKKQAAEITAGAAEAEEKARALCRWLYDNIEKRPVLTLPDAVSVLAERRGDCNEHAVLLCAMARSVNIPARIAAGVVLYQGAFYYHAWNELWIKGRWLSVDATRNEVPADPGHIRLVAGNSEAMFRIAPLIGSLSVEVLDSKEKN